MANKRYTKELMEEKNSLNPQHYQHAIRLLENEINRIRITQERMILDHRKFSLPNIAVSHRYKFYDEATAIITEKIIVPVNRYPGYNFVGKLLGPKGTVLKAIQNATHTKISILGKGSMRNKESEEDLIKGDDPKYTHLKEPLHILIRAEAVKSLAHEGMGMALSKINKFMVPDNEKLKQDSRIQYQEEIVKIRDKVWLPVKEHPKFNFIGKLLGPKGNTLKSIQSITQTRISILGEGSLWDKEKEEELIEGNDPKYKHLKEPLHILIQVEGPKSEAHTRLGAALKEIKKCLEPESEEKTEIDATYFNFKAGMSLQSPIFSYGFPPPGSLILSAPLHLGCHGDDLTSRSGLRR